MSSDLSFPRVLFSLARFVVFVAFAMVTFWTPAGAKGDEARSSFLVRSWYSEDGLPGSVVRSVAQAADGYLWVATAEGTVRFDGVRFTGFDREPDATLGRIPPRALFPLPDGSVWIATGRGGLLRWNGRRLEKVWEEAALSVSSSQVAHVTQVIGDARRGAFVTRGAEVWHVSMQRSPERIERTAEIEQLFRRDSEALAQRGRPLPGAAECQLRDRKGRLWAATPVGDIVVTHTDGTLERVRVSEAGSAGRVAELHEDQEGNVWAAASEGGLVQIREGRASVLTVADGLSDRSVMTVLKDRTGALWVAGRSGGLDRVANGEVKHFAVGEGRFLRPVSALCEDRSGTIWAATRHGSVFRLEGETFRPIDEWPKAVVIAEDARGRLWLGGQQGLAVVDAGQLIRITGEHGFTAAEVTSLAIGLAGEIWVGTSTGVIFRGEKDHFQALGTEQSLEQRFVSALLPDADGSLWVATLGAGLFHWKGGQYTRFGSDQGLPDARLTAVLQDRGNLWLGSLAGIFRISKADLADIAGGKRGDAQWLQLDRSDGLLSRECTGGNHPSAWRGRDGRLWFPTVKGVVSLQPDRMDLNPIAPPVVVEQCRANGERLSLASGSVKAGPGRSRLEFRYAGLSFTAPEKVRFRVRLEGLDSEWSEAGPLRVASYEAVPPGSYRFRVIAMNGDGVWNETGADVAVLIAPHFWETAWFRAGLAGFASLMAVSLGWWIARARLRRRVAQLQLQAEREKERIRIAHDLHDDLGASLTEISLLAHLAAEERSPGPSDRAALPEIAAKAHALVGTLDEIVWAVSPRHDTLESLADYVAASASEFLDSAGIALRLGIARPLPELPLDAETRHGLFLAVREALNNVVKHSGADEVWLRVRVEDRELEIIVEDNGSGAVGATDEFSEGLRGMRQRLTQLGGRCVIESTPGEGTRVRFSLLLR